MCIFSHISDVLSGLKQYSPTQFVFLLFSLCYVYNVFVCAYCVCMCILCLYVHIVFVCAYCVWCVFVAHLPKDMVCARELPTSAVCVCGVVNQHLVHIYMYIYHTKTTTLVHTR